MNDCRFGVSPVNYPDPDPEHIRLEDTKKEYETDIIRKHLLVKSKVSHEYSESCVHIYTLGKLKQKTLAL